MYGDRDLKVSGIKSSLFKKNENICMSIGKQKFYKVYSAQQSIEEEEENQDKDDEVKVTELKLNKEQISKVSIQTKKEKILKEILISRSMQKKQAEEERHLLPMAHQNYPSCKMLIDIGKNQKQSIEEIKRQLFTQTQKKPTTKFPSFDDVLCYASNAYHELYEQHLNNAKDIIMRLQPLSPEHVYNKQKHVLEMPLEVKRGNLAPHLSV